MQKGSHWPPFSLCPRQTSGDAFEARHVEAVEAGLGRADVVIADQAEVLVGGEELVHLLAVLLGRMEQVA